MSIVNVVQERVITLTLTQQQADVIFSILGKRQAQSEISTSEVYSALNKIGCKSIPLMPTPTIHEPMKWRTV